MENSEITELRNDVDELKTNIKDIQKTVNIIKELEESEIKHILLVKEMESRELLNLDDLKNLNTEQLDKLHKLHPKKFKDVNSWKSMIWDNCQFKIMNDTKRIVSFMCKKTNSVCSFEICPLNKIDSKK